MGDDGISQRMMDALTPNSGFVSSFKRCFFLIKTPYFVEGSQF